MPMTPPPSLFAARPGRADKAAGRAGIERRRRCVFQRLESGDDAGRQFFEPVSGGLFAGFQDVHAVQELARAVGKATQGGSGRTGYPRDFWPMYASPSSFSLEPF